VRNALTLLVLVVSRPLAGASDYVTAANTGFGAIRPALDEWPTFLESLVQRLSASDHALCASALHLVNALMRDAVANGGENEWPKFIKRLQDLGVIGGVGMLMRGEAAVDMSSPLAAAILEFQGLTKILLRKWRGVKVNTDLSEHKRALKTVHLLSRPEKFEPIVANETNGETNGRKPGKKHHDPEKWRRLGFETERPAWEFEETGYLGIMDLVDYARRNNDNYHKIFLEQSVQPREQRCPVVRASLGITLILYEHFEVDETAEMEAPVTMGHARGISAGNHFDQPRNLDKVYRPLLLQWGRLHTAALNAFLRLWKLSGAEVDDFYKIEELIRIVVERVVGTAPRRTDIAKVEEDMRTVTLDTARKWQMDGLNEVYEDAWGPHLVQVREQLYHESLQFMKEQRIRCMLQGSWFPTAAGANVDRDPSVAWRFVRLSHNRRWLHHQVFASRSLKDPKLEDLRETIDLNTVTSVDSNVSASEPGLTPGAAASTISSTSTPHDSTRPAPQPTTKITIFTGSSSPSAPETALLDLFPPSAHLAAEWLDGLLLLLNQQPITKSTTSLIQMMTEWGVRLRMLNLRWEDVDWEDLEMRVKGLEVGGREVPGREGIEEEFWYKMENEA
jgi:engulfment/cell motility protein 1